MILDPQKAFRESAQLTSPLVKLPKNVREAFDIVSAGADGIWQIEAKSGMCLYDHVYVFSDINYKKKDLADKKSVLLALINFLNFMSVDFKISIANEYRNMAEFITQIFNEINQDDYPMLSKGMRQYITQKLNEGNIDDLEQVMYLTITCRADSREEAAIFFKGMDLQIDDLFGKMGSVIFPLDGIQRLTGIRKFFYDDEDQEAFSFEQGKDPLLDVIPYSMESFQDYMVINGHKYMSVLFARRYGSSLDEEETIHSLTNVSYPSIVTIDYAPVDKEVLDAKLENTNVNNERAIAQEIDTKSKNNQLVAGISYSRNKKKNEIEKYMEQVDSNNEASLLVGLMVVVTADSLEELTSRVQDMQNTGKKCKVYLETYDYVQRKALITALPCGCRRVEHRRAFLSSSLVALQPFYAQDLVEPGGTMYGLNRTTQHFVFGNRKKLKSPHCLLVGPTGSGKSFLMKMTDITQTLLLTDDDICMIDPQNEMQHVCEDYGGQFIDFTPKSAMYLNPMEIPQEVFKDPDRHDLFVASQSEWASTFCEAAMWNITFTQEHRSDIDTCIRQIYEEKFSKKRMGSQPTIVDLRQKIKDLLDTSEYDADQKRRLSIYNCLEQFTVGSYDLFAHPTNVSMDNRFMVFGLKNIKEELWEPVMITIMHFLEMRMEYNQALQRATHFIVDEGQVVAEHKGSAQILLKTIVTYRKFGGICTFAAQNLTRVIENPELRDTFSNCGCKIFFDAGGVDAQTLSQVVQLSDSEYHSLEQIEPGYAIMAWNKKIILLDCRMSRDNVLYDHFDTDFHNKHKVEEEKEETSGSVNERLFVPTLGKTDEDKEKIKQMASLVGVSTTDVATALRINNKEARDLLLMMCKEGTLVSDHAAGMEYYYLKEK